MRKQVSVSEAIAPSDRAIAVGVPHEFPARETKLHRFAGLVAAVLLVGGGVWMALPYNGIFSSGNDSLLLSLAELSREGARTLCSPKALEKKLGIRIGDSDSALSDGEVVLVPITSANNSVVGTYARFPVASGAACQLKLRFARQRFCDTDSARVQRLVGARLVRRLAIPGELGAYDHGYAFARQGSEERSILGWRRPTSECLADVDLVSVVG
jgi:hypothetical protein